MNRRQSLKTAVLTLNLLLGVSLMALAKPPTFTSIDFPGAISTFGAFEINARADIVGRYTADGKTHGFLLSGGGFTSIDFPGVNFTVARGINPAGDIVGRYISAGVSPSDEEHLYFNRFEASRADECGWELGIFCSRDRCVCLECYYYCDLLVWCDVYDLCEGSFTTIDPPDAVAETQATGINPRGDIVGGYMSAGVRHGFLLSK